MLPTNKISSQSYWLMDLIFIAIVVSLFYAIWIGGYPLFTPDEGRYSEVAREMVATGDYVTPKLNGVPFLDKPVFYYWLQASAILLLGLKESALRFWPAFLGVFGCLMTYLTGNLLFNRRTGIISALILATSPLYYGGAHYANLDLEVAVFISCSLLCFMMAMQLQRTSIFIAAYVFAALAALTKGLIGIVFPAMIICSWLLLLNRMHLLKKIHLVTGLTLFTLITVPWYVMVQKANPEFLHFFFVTQQVSRFLTTADFNNKVAIWFYIPIVLIGFFPWSTFIIQAVTRHIKVVWNNRTQYANELFLLLWLFLIFLFFSIPHSKTIGYILPIFPALALLVGNYLSLYWDQLKTKGVYRGVITYIVLLLKA